MKEDLGAVFIYFLQNLSPLLLSYIFKPQAINITWLFVGQSESLRVGVQR